MALNQRSEASATISGAGTSTRDRLVTAAAELFSKHGFGPIGLDRVIAEVGVTKTTFYNHFESKDELIIAVLDQRHAIEAAELEREIIERGGDSPKAQMLAIFDALDDWFHQSDFRGCIFMNAAAEFPSPTDPINRAARVHSESLYELVRQRAERAGFAEPDTLAGQFVVLITGAIAARHSSNQLDAAMTARRAAETVLQAQAV